MEGIRKEFSPSLHQANDPRAREAFIARAAMEEFIVYEHPNKYAVDIVIGSPIQAYVELEVKKKWTGYDYPYPGNVHILARKDLMEENRWLCVMSNNLKRCALIHSYALKHSPCVENPNELVPEGEYAYLVPMDLVVFFDLK